MTQRSPRQKHDLYRLVETYAGFGNHHSGTDVETATIDWLAEELERAGAQVETTSNRCRVPFDRFVVEAELIGPSGSIPSVPVFYSSVGDVTSDDLEVRPLPGVSVGDPAGLDQHLESEREGLVLIIDGPPELPVQANRDPTTQPGSTPAVIVAGDTAGDLDGVSLRWTASIETGTTSNIVADLGPSAGPRVTVSTPLTGWTPAAGERGTGLAAALAMIDDLAADHRVRFVGTGGHELAFIGLDHYLTASDVNEIAGPVIQLGASVGAMARVAPNQAPVLDPGRITLTTANPPRRWALSDIVADGNWRMADLENWPGEGGVWHRAGADILAFLGHAPFFHTLGDLPEVVTTPDLLATATDVAIRAARRFLAPPDSKPSRRSP